MGVSGDVGDHQAEKFADYTVAVFGVGLASCFESFDPKRNLSEIFEVDNSGTKAIIGVVGGVGNFIGKINDLSFKARKKVPSFGGVIIGGLMFHQAIQSFASEVETNKIGIWIFKEFNCAFALVIVLEVKAVFLEDFI